MIDCDSCRHRAACSACIPFPSEDIIRDCRFICPVCHCEKHKTKPYYVSIGFRSVHDILILSGFHQAFLHTNGEHLTSQPTPIATLEARGWFSRADTSSLLIVTLRLSTMSVDGHPPAVVESHIKNYFPLQSGNHGSLRFVDIPFSLLSRNETKDHKNRLNDLVREWKKWVFIFCCVYFDLSSSICSQNYGRALVFLTTHSDPDRGDLHAAKGAAATPDDVTIHVLIIQDI